LLKMVKFCPLFSFAPPPPPPPNGCVSQPSSAESEEYYCDTNKELRKKYFVFIKIQ
jgi:hypothetical protein